MKINKIRQLYGVALCMLLLLTSCGHINQKESYVPEALESVVSQMPEDDTAYVTVNNNMPTFTEEEIGEASQSYESYSPLDDLGRCGVAMASIGQDLMPTEARGEIYQVKPTGWRSVQYDFVDGGSLYNRCHLIGFQLSGENANERNLITGTRYMNTIGMLPFENMVADYVKETNNHVLYRVTPVFDGDNLVASGVLMEGYSVEDGGQSVCFNIFAYNIQPGVVIDYATGDNHLADTSTAETTKAGDAQARDYVLNTKSRKFHQPDCSGATGMSDNNRQEYTGTREELIEQGYEPCGSCCP